MAKKDDSPKPSKVEVIKENSNLLRGTIAEELLDGEPKFGSDSIQILKHHGTYQQDDRDQRAELRKIGAKDKAYMMMIRSRVTGGALTSEQMLAELQISDDIGNGTIRLTTRQAIQHHGVLKSNLKEMIQRVHAAKMSTLGACGDVNRNVMCCPAPFSDGIHEQMHAFAHELSDHFLPQSQAYYEIWLKDMEGGEKELVAKEGPEEEPIYGKVYLPRKFKIAIALPDDNCADVYTNDLGYLAVVEDGTIIGYNVLVGGGMGTTPAVKRTYPEVAKRMGFVTPEQAVKVGEAVMGVQRDFGNRSDRKVARLKYLVNDWGIEKFRAKVESYYGEKLQDCHSTEVHGYLDHMGWHEQGDGRWFYGLNIENGRVQDTDAIQLKSAIREICETLKPNLRVTAHQSLLFADIEADARDELMAILQKHHVRKSEDFSESRRWSMACVAWPTCGLAITESERALPGIIDQFEKELDRIGLGDEKFTIRMTGCPNGCARPYNADVGLIGKAKNAYTIYLGGGFLGKRVGSVFMEKCQHDELIPTLTRVFEYFKANRNTDETFGDFCDRIGNETLLAETSAA